MVQGESCAAAEPVGVHDEGFVEPNFPAIGQVDGVAFVNRCAESVPGRSTARTARRNARRFPRRPCESGLLRAAGPEDHVGLPPQHRFAPETRELIQDVVALGLAGDGSLEPFEVREREHGDQPHQHQDDEELQQGEARRGADPGAGGASNAAG